MKIRFNKINEEIEERQEIRFSPGEEKEIAKFIKDTWDAEFDVEEIVHDLKELPMLGRYTEVPGVACVKVEDDFEPERAPKTKRTSKNIEENFDEQRKISIDWNKVKSYLKDKLDWFFEMKDHPNINFVELYSNGIGLIAGLTYNYNNGDDEIEIEYTDKSKGRDTAHSWDELVELIKDNCTYKKRLKENAEDELSYQIFLYYDFRRRGLEDDFETNDKSEAIDKAWEFINKGGYVEIYNTKTGRSKLLNEDEIEDIDDASEWLNDQFNEIDMPKQKPSKVWVVYVYGEDQEGDDYLVDMLDYDDKKEAYEFSKSINTGKDDFYKGCWSKVKELIRESLKENYDEDTIEKLHNILSQLDSIFDIIDQDENIKSKYFNDIPTSSTTMYNWIIEIYNKIYDDYKDLKERRNESYKRRLKEDRYIPT